MKYYTIAGVKVSAIALGCMRLGKLERSAAAAHIAGAVDRGINFFDHADIYGRGESEKLFACAVKDAGLKRSDLVLQSKCGIVPGMGYDMSKAHIVEAVNGSLERLQTDYLDFLLLHRPDTLMEPDEVAEAFDKLYAEGKVRAFGVSNFNPAQIEMLSAALGHPLLFDQMQFGPTFTGMINNGICVNTKRSGSIDHDGSLLEYTRLKGITIQAWSPYQAGFPRNGTFVGDPAFAQLNKTLDEIAAAHGITLNGAVAAWILRHPAHMQVIAGTTDAVHLSEVCAGTDVELSRKEWYDVYKAAGNIIP